MTDFDIETVDDLRQIYPAPKGPPVEKTLYALDKHCRNFIAHSPLLLLGTEGDVSPRGDDPGFVQVADDNTLIIPDRKGNSRVDSLENIIRNPTIGILFLVPGMDVTLRIRGQASLTQDPEILEPLALNDRPPATAMVVKVTEAFLHCGKALIRADVWNPDAQVADDVFPPVGQMYADHMGTDRDKMENRYDEHIAEDLEEEGRIVRRPGR
tara:strand:+ start:4632 stop:5264 length:633 start_codon:yes stop_codon:yes gene_type:complete